MVRFFHVARSFPGADVLVDVHLAIDRGELALISGAAGSGKTTLARILLGLDAPRRGWVTIDGLVLGGALPGVLAAHRRRVAAIPQEPVLVADRTAAENVAMALEVARVGAADARRRAELTLERLGIEALAGRRAGALSRGERQWVAIARALVRGDAQLVVADEPADGLDERDARIVGELLEEERALGKTVIAFSRSPGLRGARPSRLLELDEGRVVESMPTAALRRRAS